MADNNDGRCGTCIYWKQFKDWDMNLGSCERLTNAPQYQNCKVYDDSDPITTGIMFGCVHYSKKETHLAQT